MNKNLMIKYEKYQLSNGLKVILSFDDRTPLTAVNILYDVGSKDEHPEKTGYAHLLEHLMFEASVNIPKFDEPLQKAGAENNAFTNTDITNYYITIPAQNIETALWLESDRMLGLAFSEKKLEIQKKVVIEEFKQSYLNQPYGDIWIELRNLAYTKHPYKWPTIGKKVEHIANATLDDIKNFYNKHYSPSNAILTIVGNYNQKTIKKTIEKWFNSIPAGEKYIRNLPKEPKQKKKRTKHLTRNVPQNAIYKVWHCCGRKDDDFYATDFISDILSLGKSSVMYNELVKDKKYFTEINAYITGETEPGLFVVSGFVSENIDFQKAEKAIDYTIEKLFTKGMKSTLLQKVKNKAESRIAFSNLNILDRAMNLSYYELLDDIELINTELEYYLSVDEKKIIETASKIFKEENSSVIYYQSQSQ